MIWTILIFWFTVMSSFVLITALPVMFVSSLYKLLRKHSFSPLLKPLSIAGGLAAGMCVAWYLIVVQYGWNLSLGETFYAAGHSDIYGGLEDAAEDFIFFTLFLGNLGAILAGIACWLVAKSRRQIAQRN